MSVSKLHGVFLLLLLTSTANQAAAENGALIGAFGGDPGSPVPHAYSSGKPPAEDPTYTLRIAVLHPKLQVVFYDTVLTVRTADKIVQKVTAARAYRDFNQCNAAREITLAKLVEGLPSEYAEAGDDWDLQSTDGKVVGRAVCGKRRHDPMPVLDLEIALKP
jgi:hypothetical protein